jgi:hypothetical protein
VEPSPVEIGGKACRKGDMFAAKDTIRWAAPGQALKAFDATSGKMKVLTEALMSQAGKQTMWDYVTSSRRLSTRDGKLLNPVELSAFFNRTVGMLERISTDAYLPVDDHTFYYVGYDYAGETVNKKLPVNGNAIIIDRSIFIIDGVRKEPFNTRLALYYYDAVNEQSRTVADSLVLYVVEVKECRAFIDSYKALAAEDRKELMAEYLSVNYPDVFFQEADIELFLTELLLNTEQK